MPTIPLPDPFFDGDFDHAIEIEGGPTFSTDEVTKSMSITRQYVVKADNYVPLPQGTKDRQYQDAVLIEESPGQRQGPLLYFSRLYWNVPVARTEPRTVSFSTLGKSSVDYSLVTLLPIGWNQYGAGAPNTRDVNATVEFSYKADPTLFTRPPITRNTYNGIPVDFYGFVYDYVGNVKVSDEITEPRWRLAGSTFYGLPPALWIQSVIVSRWRGPIWQMEIVKVFPNIL